MVKSKEQGVSVTLDFSGDAFRDFQFFNRYSVAAIDGGLLLDFGFLDKSGFLLSSASALFSAISFGKQKTNIEDYFGRAAANGTPVQDITVAPWQIGNTARPIYVVDFLGLAEVDGLADIELFHIPTRRISTSVAASKGKDVVKAIPIITLRSSVDVHKAFLRDLLKTS